MADFSIEPYGADGRALLRGFRGVEHGLSADELGQLGDVIEAFRADTYLILSVKSSPGIYGRALWYGPDCKGYTEDISRAGRYTQAGAESITSQSGLDLRAVPLREAEELAQPSVRWCDAFDTWVRPGEEVAS